MTQPASAAPATALTLYYDKAAQFEGAVSMLSTLSVSGSMNLGNGQEDILTCAGRLVLREIANTTNKAGTKKELVYNTADNKVYCCTVASESAATWVALNYLLEEARCQT